MTISYIHFNNELNDKFNYYLKQSKGFQKVA